jgi:SHS2 domain-containing protein
VGEVFVEAGCALAVLACGDRPLPAPDRGAARVSLQARDREALLVDWLNELVFRSETEQLVFVDLRLSRLTDRELEAEIRGAAAPDARALVKAATLHDVHVVEGSDGASASVILDV